MTFVRNVLHRFSFLTLPCFCLYRIGVFWDPAKEAWCVLLCLPSCLSPSSLCESFRYGLIQRKIVCFRAKYDYS